MSRSLGRIYEGLISPELIAVYTESELDSAASIGEYAKVYAHNERRTVRFKDGKWHNMPENILLSDYIKKTNSYDSIDKIPVEEGKFLIRNNYYHTLDNVFFGSDNKWVPVSNEELVALKDIFSNMRYENNEDIPTDNIPENFVITVEKNIPEKYYVKEESGWKETEKRNPEWQRLVLYKNVTLLPNYSYSYEYDEEKKTTVKKVREKSFDELLKSKNIYLVKDYNGKKFMIEKMGPVYTGVGAFGDYYVSTVWGDDNITGRGVPDDVSKEVHDYFYNLDDDQDEIFRRKILGYDHTYVTLAELSELRDKLFNESIQKVIDRVNEDNSVDIHKKLDFILEHLAEKEDDYKKNYSDFITSNAKNRISEEVEDTEYADDIDEFDDEWKQPLKEYIDEVFEKVFAVDSECEYANVYADAYGLDYKKENVRIIYFID